MVTECLLTRSMLIKMYYQAHRCLFNHRYQADQQAHPPRDLFLFIYSFAISVTPHPQPPECLCYTSHLFFFFFFF